MGPHGPNHIQQGQVKGVAFGPGQFQIRLQEEELIESSLAEKDAGVGERLKSCSRAAGARCAPCRNRGAAGAATRPAGHSALRGPRRAPCGRCRRKAPRLRSALCALPASARRGGRAEPRLAAEAGGAPSQGRPCGLHGGLLIREHRLLEAGGNRRARGSPGTEAQLRTQWLSVGHLRIRLGIHTRESRVLLHFTARSLQPGELNAVVQQ